MRDYPNQGCATNAKAEAERNYATLRAMAMDQQTNHLTPPNASTGCDVSTSSKIRDGVNWLEASLAELHKILGALEQRLEMVLTPVCPSSAAAAPTPDKAFGSHLLSRLGDLNDAVCAAKARVVDLLNRVEV